MGSSKSTTNTNGTQNTQITPTNPSWVTEGLGHLGTHIDQLNNIDPASLVSGPNAQQTGAATALDGLGGLSHPALGSSAFTLSHLEGTSAPTIDNGGGSQQIAPLISQFMNPNLRSVVDPALAAYDFGAGQQQGQLALQQAGDGAWGSGGQLGRSLLGSQLALGRGQLASGLYGDAYNSGLTGATNQANLQESAAQRVLDASKAQAAAIQQNRAQALQAAQSLANVGLADDSNTRANAGALTDVGNNLRGITQQQLAAPISTAASIAGLYGAMPLNLLHGQNQDQQYQQTSTTKTSPSLMDSLGSIVNLGGSLASGLTGLGIGSGLGLSPMTAMTSGVQAAAAPSLAGFIPTSSYLPSLPG